MIEIIGMAVLLVCGLWNANMGVTYLAGLPASQLAWEEELKPYVSEFWGECLKLDIDAQYLCASNIGSLMYVGWGETGEGLGYCQKAILPPKFSRIIIDRQKWAELGEFQRKALMYHELGHCLLDRDHQRSYGKSLMEVGIREEEYHKTKWPLHVREMFKPL